MDKKPHTPYFNLKTLWHCIKRDKNIKIVGNVWKIPRTYRRLM
jgi:hypothetical protein